MCRSTNRSWSREEGIALLASLLVMLLISALGASMLVVSTADIGASANYRGAKAAFYEADSGIQRSIMDLVASSDWSKASVDGSLLPIVLMDPFPTTLTINGNTVDLSAGAGWYQFGAPETLGTGTFTREIWLPPIGSEQANAKGSKLWVVVPVRSTGTIAANGSGPSTQIVQSDLRVMIFRVSIWDNAVFAGRGQAGKSITGNVEIRGSVHVVGDPNHPTLLDWGGGATVRNSYVDAGLNSNWDADAVKLPSLPLVDVNGEMVQSLDAEVRVRNGDLDYGGSSSLGDPNIAGNTRKEMLDGFYADGTVTLSGSAAIFADAQDDYDIDEAVPFPTLDDPYVDPVTGVSYPTHRDYLNTVGLTLPVNEISDNTPAFSLSDLNGNSVDWNPATHLLQIHGICRVDGDLKIGKNGTTERIEYSGTGTIYATDDISFTWDLMPVGDYLNTAAAVTHNIGLIADDDVDIATSGGASWLKLMAAVYAEDQIHIALQTRVAGALVGNYFDMGNNVPQLWQVPRLAVNLPPGMPGGNPLLYAQRSEVSNWMQVRR